VFGAFCHGHPPRLPTRFTRGSGAKTHPAVGRRQIIDDLLPTRRLSTTRWWQFVLVRESLEDTQEYEHDGGRNGDDHRGAPHRRCDPVPPMPFYIVFRQ